jgi:lipopolysaccharide biosynthesis regulator YciM
VWEAFLEIIRNHAATVFALALSCIAGFLFGKFTKSRSSSRTSKPPARRDEAFFKGFQYILSNDHDHAIEEFTKSVKVNSDTVETYVALGNLYRSKGEIERAIMIRQSIILRANIEESIRLRALFDLGLDYRKGGLINRALSVFLDVVKRAPEHLEALEEIEKIYEELRDWENAYKTRQRIARIVRGDHEYILAHHQVELGKVFLERGDFIRAKSLFEKAVSTHRECVDAYLHLGDLYLRKKEYKRAVSAWRQVVKLTPHFAFLAYRRLENAYTEINESINIVDFAEDSKALQTDPFVQISLARLHLKKGDTLTAGIHLERVLSHNPAFWEARRLKGEILLDQQDREAIEKEYRELLQQLTMSDVRFQCSRCGFEPKNLQWQCLQCKRWDTIKIVEASISEKERVEASKNVASLRGELRDVGS